MSFDHFKFAQRFIGVSEIAGTASNPVVLSMLKLDNDWPEGDDVPWCSAFVNLITWLCRLPRSKSLRARSWLQVGAVVDPDSAKLGDVVILKRGGGQQPGPEVIKAPGHVGFFAGRQGNKIAILGGNQADEVNVRLFPEARTLGIRRLV